MLKAYRLDLYCLVNLKAKAFLYETFSHYLGETSGLLGLLIVYGIGFQYRQTIQRNNYAYTTIHRQQYKDNNAKGTIQDKQQY